MGERRSRKSLWNTEEETHRLSGVSEHDSWAAKERHYRHPSGRYREFSASGTSLPKSRDHSGWSSWESTEENAPAPMSGSFVKSRHNAVEGKQVGGGSRCRNPYNGSGGTERRNYDQILENDRMDSYRKLGRGRSRSRSRSRTRGRSRSRSLSRSRGNERGRGWSRSRSRSRSGGNARGRTRSRSPLGYRRESYGWDDRKSVPEKSSQICREFTEGRCRRGSQCRFFHPENTSQRDGDFVEDGPGESWRQRTDHGRAPRHGLSRGPGSILCKDFIKGNCRWGDACKFSHHVGSDSSFGNSNRNASFDEDIDFQASKTTKPLCKYFAAGKCGRNNCRFSHEDPKLSHVEDSQGTSRRRLNDKSNSWDGPTWNDVTTVPDTVKTTGWGEGPLTTNTNNAVDNGKGDGSWARSLGTERESPDLPEWTGPSLVMEKLTSPPRESGTYGRDADMAESIDKENMVNRQEHLLLHHTEVQSQDRISNVQALHKLLEAQTYSLNTLHQNVPAATHTSQHNNGVAESNLVNSLSDAIHANSAYLSSATILNQNGESMILGRSSVPTEKDDSPNMLTKASVELKMDLNVPEMHTVTPLNLLAMQNHRLIVQSPRPLLFHNFLTNQQSGQMMTPVPSGQQVSNPSVVPNQRFVSEHSQNFAGIEVSSSSGLMLSISDDSGQADFVNAISAQPVPVQVAVSHDLFSPSGNGRDVNEAVNATSSQGVEPNSPIHMELSPPPPPIVPVELDNSKLLHQEIPKPKVEEVLPISGFNGGINAVGEDVKSVQEVKHFETVDVPAKVEACASKDEKGMRMLKNALIELVKDILKPKWKEGRMSRDVHKTIVKKVVDKVTSTIKGEHVPKTQDKVEQYLSSSKPKISKLVQAYVERCMKTNS